MSTLSTLNARKTREIRMGSVRIGAGHPIVVQSMTATKTLDIDATTAQIHQLAEAGAGLVRVAVDTRADADALAEIRKQTPGINLSVDLQENYRLAERLAPHVDKIRYNPGHLHHVERDKSVKEKAQAIAEIAKEHELAIRVGVNAGSLAPELAELPHVEGMVRCAVEHCAYLDEVGFTNYCVSLKDSDPALVVAVNRSFAQARPDVPIHLGVTEAGLPPDGIIKTRIAFEQLIPAGIGDTVRVSLTLPNDRKHEEVIAGHEILEDIANGRFRSVPPRFGEGMNIISCPSCSRVENEAFVELAQRVREMTEYARDHDVTIAVMGCRVNGPGETDDADLGLWCGPTKVNLKRGAEKVGSYGYDEILDALRTELDALIDAAA